MARSTVFDTKLRFEIGRNELRSDGSSDGFFSSGRVIALFWLVGRTPSLNDALHIPAMTGAMTGPNFLTNHVGIGSSGQCLAGEFLMILSTSSAVTGRNADSGSDTVRPVITGCGAVAVDVRIAPTFR